MTSEKLNSNSAQWLPSLKALRALETVARHMSFQLAAKELGVSTAAVHQLVRGLEETLDKKLVVRNGRDIEISDAARSGLADLDSSFRSLVDGVRKIREHGVRRQLRISVEPSFAHAWLVGRLSKFQNANKDIDVLIDSSTRVADLARGEADVAIRYAFQIDGELRSRLLFEDETIAVCSPTLMKGRKCPLDLRSLGQMALLHFDWPHNPQIQADWSCWTKMLGWSSVLPSAGLRFTDYNAVIQSAVAGQGVALVSRPLVADALATGVLVEPVNRAYKNGYKYFIATKYRQDSNEFVDNFIDWVCKESSKTTTKMED
ncbi:LysR substrate-binding domain-containing protein [Thalassospira sp. MA62]|nr:LysR substrate-binding domain-containing protein [Thalassospira sp. MA62]